MTRPGERLTDLAGQFRERFNAAKAQLKSQPKIGEAQQADEAKPARDSLAAIPALENLLISMGATLADVAGGLPVVDLSCGDGALAFFLESIGCRVVAVTSASDSAEQQDAVSRLKVELESAAHVREGDPDEEMFWSGVAKALPAGAPCGLAVMLEVLEHLRSPVQVLQRLAESADYCFLSARVARFASDGTAIATLPVMYLLDTEGTDEGPPTGYTGPVPYWVFSETGLRRLAKRTGWEICAYQNAGDTAGSKPVGEEHQELFYCLLRRADLFTNGRVLEGWYPAEGPRDGWRWMADIATVRFSTPGALGTGTMRFVFFVPPERFEATGPFTVGVMKSGEVLASYLVEQPGLMQLNVALPARMGLETVEKEADVTLWVSPPAATSGDERLLGVIVRQILLIAGSPATTENQR